jgi:hypothetical protein
MCTFLLNKPIGEAGQIALLRRRYADRLIRTPGQQL